MRIEKNRNGKKFGGKGFFSLQNNMFKIMNLIIIISYSIHIARAYNCESAGGVPWPLVFDKSAFS